FNAWSRLNSQELLPLLANDLEPPAFALRPELSELRAGIERRLSRVVRMSGSGSSLFTLFDNLDQGTQAAQAIEKAFPVRAICVELAPILRDDLHDDR